MLAAGIDIHAVTSRASDSSGVYRDVYFVNESIVLKVNISDAYGFAGQTNAMEYANYNRLRPLDGQTFTSGGIDITVRFPKMEMFGDFLIAERVPFEHLDETCPSPAGCGEDDHHCSILNAMDRIAAQHLQLFDMHSENFCFDWDTWTAWVVDLGA